MPARLPLGRRISTAARWPVGVGLTAWRYLWRTVPMRRWEEPGDPVTDAAPELPGGVSSDAVQLDGAGPLFHRRYRIRMRETALSARELLACVAADPDRVAPSEFASFHKVRGEPGEMAVGDEYVVRMASPWDGPVRVVERTPASFRFVTLEGHLEAGQIRFSAHEKDGLVVFEIESWARSAGRLVDLMYDRLRFTKEVQVHMWVSTLQRVAELSGGRRTHPIDLHTRRVPVPGDA